MDQAEQRDEGRASDSTSSDAEGSGPVPPSSVVFEIRCPLCGAETTADLSQAGKRGRCGDCGGEFTILAPPGVGPIPVLKTSEGAAPFDGPPHRADKIVGLGIAALTAVAITVAVSACCPYVPIDLVGIILGIVATVMARSDLAKMARGEMDPSGRQKTTLGYGLAVCAAVSGFLLFVTRLIVLAMTLSIFIALPMFAPRPPGGPMAVPTTPPPKAAAAQSLPGESDDVVVPLEVRDLDR